MKEFFETLDVKEFQEYKRWLNSMAANETEQVIAEKFLNFMEKLEQSAAEEYEICFDYPLDETKELSEQCPYCGEEFIISWNLKKHGTVAHCPYCGNEIRLCSSCPTSKGYGECDYDNDSKCCRYHIEPVKEPKVVKKAEDTQKSNETKSSKETTISGSPKKEPDLLHEIESSSGKNTKISYYYKDSDGNKHYKEVVFSGLLNEDEKKMLFEGYDGHKIIPKFLNFPYDKEEGIGLLLGFSSTTDKSTSAMTIKELMKSFEFYGFLRYKGVNIL